MAGRRPKVTAEDFVAAGLDFVVRNGLDALTTRALGNQMGVDSTAIYRHFPHKDDLLVAMRDDLHRQINEQLDLDGLSPKDAIARIARVTRTVYGANPELSSLHSTMHGALPHTAATTRIILGQLEKLGLSGEDLVVSYQMLEGAVVGSMVFDNSGAPANHTMRMERYRYLGGPAFAAAATNEERVREISNAAFERLLTVVLDAIEKTAHAPTYT